QLHVLGPHARQVGVQHQLVLQLIDVHARREVDAAARTLGTALPGPLFPGQMRLFRHDPSPYRGPGAAARRATRTLVISTAREAHSPLTTILRGLADSCLTSWTRSTPCSSRASTLFASTANGSATVRQKVPKLRSWRCRTPFSGTCG